MDTISTINNLDDKVVKLQEEMLKLPQVELTTDHYFCNGMYARRIFSKASTLIVGKRHKTEHFYMVLTGCVQVNINDQIVTLDADKDGPQILNCPIGTKRAVYVIRDSWRLNVHLNLNNVQELEELENNLVEEDKSSPYLPGNKLRQEVLA